MTATTGSSPSSGSSNLNRKKETVKFSTLDHPPRAHLLPPAALLSLLCLAFLCLLFVCFRNTEWIIKMRRNLQDLIRRTSSKLIDWFQAFKLDRERRIRLIEEGENEAEETNLMDRMLTMTRTPSTSSASSSSSSSSKLNDNLNSNISRNGMTTQFLSNDLNQNLFNSSRSSIHARPPILFDHQDETDEDDEVLPQI